MNKLTRFLSHSHFLSLFLSDRPFLRIFNTNLGSVFRRENVGLVINSGLGGETRSGAVRYSTVFARSHNPLTVTLAGSRQRRTLRPYTSTLHGIGSLGGNAGGWSLPTKREPQPQPHPKLRPRDFYRNK